MKKFIVILGVIFLTTLTGCEDITYNTWLEEEEDAEPTEEEQDVQTGPAENEIGATENTGEDSGSETEDLPIEDTATTVEVETEDVDTEPEEEGVLSCRSRWEEDASDKTCVEYLSPAFDRERVPCNSRHFFAEPCPVEDARGYCDIPGFMKTFWYGETIFDDDFACAAMSGTWVPFN